LSGDDQRQRDEAEVLKKKSMLDVLKEQGLAFLLDFLGITDILNCFTKGSLGSCVSVLVDIIPGAKFFKSGAKILKGIKKSFEAYQVWQKAIKWADDVIKRTDELLAAARKKADDLAAAAGNGAAAACNSFVPGTRVLMADGTRRAIEHIVPGDEVESADPTTGEKAPKRVTAAIAGSGKKLLIEVSVEHSDNVDARVETITATGGHPFWVENQRLWRDASSLKVGDYLLRPDGSRVKVVATAIREAYSNVYNLTVDDLHTYFVAPGASSVLVHNTNPVGGSCPVADAAREAADVATNLPNRIRPAVVEGIQLPGQEPIVRGSLRGPNPPTLNGLVSAVLNGAPRVAYGGGSGRGSGHGRCGLPQCLSVAINAGHDPTGAEAAAYLVRSSRNHPSHGNPIGPCLSCEALSYAFRLVWHT